MAVYLISADHRSLDLETVSRLGAAAPGLGRDLLADLPRLRGALVLATCNRVAVLLDSADPEHAGPADPGGSGPDPAPGRAGGVSRTDLVAEVTRLLARRAGLAEEGLAPMAWRGAEAHRELFSTASGLESMVVGERQVAGQLRRALRAADQEGTLSPELVRVVEHALVVSRRVAAETGVAGRGRSLAAVGVDLAAGHLPPLSRCRVLLVGTGSYAGATVAVLRDNGAADVSVYSASDRARVFAEGHGLGAVVPDGLETALAGADLVITCRGLGTPVLTRDLVERAAGRRLPGVAPARPLVVLDLSLVRDVEPGVADLPGVVYLDLRRIQAEVPEADAEDLAAARAVVAQESEEFERFLDGRRMDGLIRGLRSQVEGVVEQEAARLRPRPTGAGGADGAGGGGDEPVVTLAEAQQALRRLAARLLHQPTTAARRAGEEGRAEEFRAALETVLGPEAAAGAGGSAGPGHRRDGRCGGTAASEAEPGGGRRRPPEAAGQQTGQGRVTDALGAPGLPRVRLLAAAGEAVPVERAAAAGSVAADTGTADVLADRVGPASAAAVLVDG